jgi:hypothetical protein
MLPRYKSFFGSLLVACTAVALVGVAHAGPPPGCTLDAPIITCVSSTPTSITLRVCAGPSGAPAGISIQWKTCADFAANGWSSGVGDSYTSISLSGQCPTSNWDLGPNECRNVTINASTVINENAGACGASGNPADLLCNTCYVFRSFAHNIGGSPGCNRSDFSPNVQCTTAPCPEEGECTLSWGYWKTHGPAGCNPPGKENKWPVASLNIGGLNLGQAALCEILQENPGACNKSGQSNGGSNAVIILEHQLIAAMFNAANGSINCDFADAAIAEANALLVGYENACVGSSTPLGAEMIAVASALESYNNDQCTCPVAAPKASSATAPTNVKKSSWGQVKSIYR